MKIKAYALLILVVGVSLLCLFLLVKMNECVGYSCLEFKNKNEFKEIARGETTKLSYHGTLKRKDIQIRIESYDSPTKEIASQFTQAKIMQLEGLFETARSPYPGALSNEIVCEDTFKPQFIDKNIHNTTFTEMIGYLNERLQYGSCIESQLAYKGRTALLYCPMQKRWYWFEVIAKRNDPKLDLESAQIIESLKCQMPFGK